MSLASSRIIICRLCLQNFEKNEYFLNLSESLNDEEHETITYEEAFTECTGFVVDPSEPQDICEMCAYELTNAYRFKERSKRIQIDLEKLLEAEFENEVQVKFERHNESDDDCLIVEQNDELSTGFQDEIEERFLCSLCPEKHYNSKKNLQEHWRNKHPNENFAPPVMVKRSRRNVTPDPKERKFFCGLCDRSYKNQCHLKDHYASKHANEPLYDCPQCDARHYQQLLYYHLVIRHKIQPERITGSQLILNESFIDTFDTPSDEYSDVSQNRKKPKPSDDIRYHCDLCEREYKRRHHLKDHYEIKHRDQEMFDCPECDYRHYLQILRLHLKHMHRIEPEDIF